jgi:hypothetical protein
MRGLADPSKRLVQLIENFVQGWQCFAGKGKEIRKIRPESMA